ncbi:MAG: hypothetical protein HYZ34_05110 [Ignavibacteriae bacterium]|nr:hypothetical protein [Ignavibacteriota bacterium]
MKQVLSILILLVIFHETDIAQISSFRGELRYEQNYHDYRSGGTLTKFVSRSPRVNLQFRGSLLSPKILTYSLFTSLYGNFSTSSNEFFNYYGEQFSWNRYNLTMNVIPTSPVKLNLSFRDNDYTIKTESGLSIDRLGSRSQEQRAELSVQQIPWLPSMSLSYVRSRSFATAGNEYEIVNHTLSFTASSASDTTGLYNLSVVTNTLREDISNAADRFIAISFSASRALAEQHHVSLTTEYNKYAGFSLMQSALSYGGVLTDRIRLATNLSGSNSMSSYSQGLSVGLSQSVSMSMSEHFQGAVGISGFLGHSKNIIPQFERSDAYRSGGLFGNLQHRRVVAGFTLANGLSAGKNIQFQVGQFSSWNTQLSNSISRTIGSFSTSGYYNFSLTRVNNVSEYTIVGNTAGIILRGTLPYKIQSQSDVRYREDRYPGNESSFRSHRNIIVTQRMNGSFTYIIPFTLSVSGNANWFFTGNLGRSYGWTFNFSSPSFFLRGLMVSYVYSRNFDQYYLREIADHTGSLSFNWRALSFSSRLRYATFPVHLRQVQFIVSRPF